MILGELSAILDIEMENMTNIWWEKKCYIKFPGIFLTCIYSREFSSYPSREFIVCQHMCLVILFNSRAVSGSAPLSATITIIQLKTLESELQKS